MSQQLSLNGGGWRLKSYYGEDWRWRSPHLPENGDPRSWLPASVPGTIQNDLWVAGEVPDPYFERNSLLLEWVPARTWVYRKAFTVADSLRGKRALLRFEGVDYEAQFFLNGERLGAHSGMYTPAVFDVTDLLRFGGAENLLAVVVEPAPHELPQIGRTSAVRTNKSRMTYWWDFCPRMVHIGIWDGVFIDFTGSVRIEDVFVRPQLSDDFQHADISISAQFDSRQDAPVTVAAAVRFAGEVVASTQATLEAGQTALDFAFPLENPRLWYPNGMGEQPLYDAEIRVLDSDGVELDRRITRFGIRRIEFVANEGAAPDALPYTLDVNGRRTYIKGWNWVPIDVMYGVERPAKLERLLQLAQGAHVNLLRVWGGGLIEKQAFYDRCDELGILVWQEFIMSSSGIDNNPPTDADYIAMMLRDAEQIIPKRRNHPSLAIWCGGNELMEGEENPQSERHPLLAALRAAVRRLDPDRFWLPTSPSGGVFTNSLENIERDPDSLHDVHGPWEYQGVEGQYTLYNRGSSLLHSEFGVEGITNLKTLDATIAPERQHPATLENPIWHHLGAWWVKTRTWDAAFGAVNDVSALVRATQLLQADGLRYALEADRRRKYHNSGTLPWQFNEPYPMAACTSAVDYYAQPKPSYYAVKRAYAPLLVSAKFDRAAWAGHEQFSAEIWLNHSHHDQPITNARLQVALVGVDGEIYADWTVGVNAAADSASLLTSIQLPLADVRSEIFLLDLTLNDAAGAPLAHNRYAFTKAENLAPLLAAPATTLTVTRQGDSLSITNAGASAALFVWLEDARPLGSTGYVTFSDNYFCLLPAETRAITSLWQDVETAQQRVSITAWNAPEWKG